MIQDRLTRLRREMEKRSIAVYVVPTADFHDSEYVGPHFACRAWVSASASIGSVKKQTAARAQRTRAQ